MAQATPLRGVRAEATEHGCHVLPGGPAAPAAGEDELGERLLGLIAGVEDLSASSPELLALSRDWPTAAALSPARANGLRPLEFPADAVILEVGCGYGAVTRYLGERCAVVDALDDAPARAAVARARTRGLPGVDVFVGSLDQVPPEPAYDVVVVLDAFASVDGGTADPAPYLTFLRSVRALLRDGGTLVLGTANALGVRYVAGAPDEYTHEPFDPLEGYERGTGARSFSRAVLERLLLDAGFTAQFLAVFPDVGTPRAVMTDALFHTSPQLAVGMPRFPSPDRIGARLQLADEGLTWAQLVAAGVGRDFANGFLVLASTGEGPGLWPRGSLAALLVSDRQPEYAVRGDVREEDGGPRITRRPLYPERAEAGGLHPLVRHAPAEVEPVIAGRELLSVFLQEPQRRAELLRRWVAMVPDEQWAPVDLVPHNVVLTPDDRLVTFDQEWTIQGYGRDALLLRGVFLSAVQLAVRTRPGRLLPSRTVGDLVRVLADEGGLDVEDRLVERFIAQESAFQGVVNTTHPTEAERREYSAAELRALFERSLTDVRGGARFDLQWARARKDIDALYVALRDSEEKHQAALTELRAAAALTERALAEAQAREAARHARRPAAVARRAARAVLVRTRPDERG